MKIINEDIMKRSFLISRAAALVFAVVLAIGMANCSIGDNSIRQASDGLTTIRVGESNESTSALSARTIMPAALKPSDISKHVITLTKGQEEIIYGDDPDEDTSAITGSGVKFNLIGGLWNVTVDAYRTLADGSGDSFKAATGTGTLTVSVGGANTLTITLNPVSLANAGNLNGVFYWNLILPEGITLTTFTLGGDALTPPVNNPVISGTMGKTAGVYDLNIVLTKTATCQIYGIYEAVHIYPGLVTEANYDFTGELSFADKVLIAGSLNITRTGPPAEAVAYTVQAYSDEECTMAIAGASADITAAGTTIASVTWHIGIPAAAYTALSSKTVYLKANVSTPNYYYYVSQPVTSVANLGLQGAPGVNVSVEIWQNPQAALPVITEGDCRLTVQWSAVNGAASYEVWTNTTNNSASAAKYGGDISGTSTTITNLTNGIICYVWIKAKNSSETSDFSPVASGMPGLVFQGLKLTINTGSSNSFILPIKSQVTGLNLTIDWGDGNIQIETTAPTGDNGIPHTYTDSGEYVVRLAGSCKTDSDTDSYLAHIYTGKCGFGFNSYSGNGYNTGSNKSKIIKAEGNITALTTGSTASNYAYCYLFSGCNNLSDISGLVISETSAGNYFLYDAFNGCSSLTSTPDNFLPNITTVGDYFLYYAFYLCQKLNYIDLFSDRTILTIGNSSMNNAFYEVASSASPKLTLRIHGTKLITPGGPECGGLRNQHVLEVQVASILVQSYRNESYWSYIDDNKFVALHN